jgi:hypothetical protein
MYYKARPGPDVVFGERLSASCQQSPDGVVFGHVKSITLILLNEWK